MTVGGFEIDSGGQLTFTYGSRVAQTTNGTLICLVPTLLTLNDVEVEFPDGSLKDYAYGFSFNQTNFVYDYHQSNTCRTLFTRRPEEFSSETTLVAETPKGADIFVGRVNLSRTVAPTHTWFGQNLAPLVKTDQWLPWTGSALVEAAFGLTRALHIYLKQIGTYGDGSPKRALVMEREMSISVPAGGYGSWGNYSSPSSANSGAEVVYDVAPGLPVWTTSAAANDTEYFKAVSRDVHTENITGPPDYVPLLRGQPSQCTTVDPTDYRSLYSMDVQGYFGRRS